MFHKTISTDNGVDCYRCGTSVDFPWMPMDELIYSGHLLPDKDAQETMEQEIMYLLPSCAGPTENHGHHWYAIGADKDDAEHLIGAIDCHRCDAYVGWETDLAYVPRFCKEI